MSLIKIDQDSIFSGLAPLWEDSLSRNIMERAGWRSISNMPAVNIEEKAQAFEVTLAAPGLQRNDFVIELDNGMLTVSSKKKEEHKEQDKKGKYTRREFRYHAFSRSFTLPKAVDADKIQASYTDGILTIHLPKKELEKKQPVKQITIK